jgi:hypothetical protein
LNWLWADPMRKASAEERANKINHIAVIQPKSENADMQKAL